ncbi:MAG: hypothetical protein NC833_02760 [Candidatus Omnitrophica bacterium]|nr:hypothetical protein [Candidatus Omnitrophota bacterium]
MKRYICGIDENGFGPILGPLIITGILTDENVEIPDYIKDSKIFYRNKNDFKKIEEIAIISFYFIENKLPDSPYEIFRNFTSSKCLLDDNICEKNIPLSFKIKNLESVLGKYEDFISQKYKFKEIKINVVCPYLFNDFLNKKNSKFILNLSNFCKIIKEMAKYKNVKFFCGKIGSLTYYKKYLSYFFPEYEIKTSKEEKNFSSYQILKKNQNFEISFYKNVEKVSSLTSLSSIIGKYIREIIMESIRKSLNIKEEISGYRDGKTKKIIENIDFSKFKKECIIRVS